MNSVVELKTDLDALLEREYVALLNGELDKLETFISQKMTILQRVSTLPVTDIRQFDRLRPILKRNQRLGQSAIKGMRVAITRAKDIQDVSLGLRTYKKDGSNASVPMRSASGFSKRS